jgi:hypothetical protein
MNHLLVIPLMYLVIVSLTLWVIIATHIHWVSKLLIIIAAIYLSIIIHLSIIGLMGHPTKEKPPDTFQLLSFVVKEPHGNDGGQIYLLVIGEKMKEPRLFSMPYSRKLHKQMHELKEKMVKGTPVRGGFKRNKKSLSQNEESPIFHELPPIELPEKNTR